MKRICISVGTLYRTNEHNANRHRVCLLERKKSKLVGTQPVPTGIFLIFMKIVNISVGTWLGTNEHSSNKHTVSPLERKKE